MNYREGKEVDPQEGYYTWKCRRASALWWYAVRVILVFSAAIFIANLFIGGN